MDEVIEPRWVREVVLAGVLAVAAFGTVGLVLADLGVYKPLLVFPLGALAFVALRYAIRPLARVEGVEGVGSRASTTSAALAAVLSIGTAVWNCANAAQHVQINRDGGTYLNAGKWIATHGTLDVRPFVGAFSPHSLITVTSTDINRRGLHLEFPLSHLLSAILAEAQDIGGDRLMFLAVPMLSALSLLAFYLLAIRLLRHPFAALGATMTLAFVMPQISFSRDSTTEVPIQLLLFSAVWMLCDRRTLRIPKVAFCAGLCLGLIQAMHIDGLAFLTGLPLIFAMQWLSAEPTERDDVRRGIISSSLGVGLAVSVAALDLVLWDRTYVSTLRTKLGQLAGLEIAVIIAVVVYVMVARRNPSLAGRLERVRNPASSVMFAVALLMGLALWFVRPRVQKIRGSANAFVAYVQKLNHLAVDPTRRYAEHSVQWISWYIGPITLLLGIVGVAALAGSLVRGSLRFGPRIAVVILGPPALLYIWHPAITPDHIWAMRRLLPAALPGVILLAFAVIVAVAGGRFGRFVAAGRVTAVLLAIAAIVFPIYTIRNLSQMTEQRGLFPVITETCRNLGRNSAAIMLPETKSVAYLSDPQTLRSFCDIPVAVTLKHPSATALRALAAAWKHDGRRLYVVAEFPSSIHRVFPGLSVRISSQRMNAHLLQQTLTRRPSKYVAEIFGLASAAVPLPTSSTAGGTG